MLMYATVDDIAKAEYPKCVCYYLDGCGYVGFRSRGCVHWWKWDVYRHRYVKTGTTIAAMGAKRRVLDAAKPERRTP